MEKPIAVKAVFYAHCFEILKVIAYERGYNLLLNGSMNRDLDLVLIPWVDNPADEFAMIQEFHKTLTGLFSVQKEHYRFTKLPGGRHSYTIDLNRGGAYNGYKDALYYLDISVTPLVVNK